ncbi:hypothetical protein V2J09_017205 [Rumex salicifolius]
MVSDQQVAELLDSLLRETTPGTFTTLNDVVQLLQSRLGLDLSHKIDFIRGRVYAFYSPLYHHPPPPQPQPHHPPPSSAPAIFHQSPIFTAGAPSHPNLQYQLHFPQPQGPVFHNATEISFSQPALKPHASSVAAPVPPATKEGSQSRPKRRGGAGGLNKLCGVSPELETIVGQPAMTRTEIVKQLWVYIRKNNLQDPSNKRKIICNDELRLLFETDATDMFQMNKLLSKHILPLPPKDAGPPSKKVKVDEDPEVKNTESNPIEAVASFSSPSGREMPHSEMNKELSENSLPLPSEETAQQSKKENVEESEGKNTEPNSVVLSEALTSFFGAIEREMPQSEVFKRFSEYIRAQGLELNSLLKDPITSEITCDAKLQKLFGLSGDLNVAILKVGYIQESNLSRIKD